LADAVSHEVIAHTTSDENGYFCFDNIPPGDLEISGFAGEGLSTGVKRIAVKISGQPQRNCLSGRCNCYDVGDLLAGGALKR
jgi:hypothetical protein